MEWRPIIGFEGLYEVSEYGDVRSVDRFICFHNGSGRMFRGCALKDSRTKWGYPRYNLWKENRQYSYEAHRVVAPAFLGPCPDGMETCHNDGNVNNNHYENLRYDTHKNNLMDMLKHGTFRPGGRPRAGSS